MNKRYVVTINGQTFFFVFPAVSQFNYDYIAESAVATALREQLLEKEDEYKVSVQDDDSEMIDFVVVVERVEYVCKART